MARARAWARSATTPAKRSEETTADGTTLLRAACTDLIQYELGGTPVVHHLRYRVTLALRAGQYEFFMTDFLLESKGTLQQAQAVYTPLEDVLLANPADRAGIAQLQAIRRGFQEFRQQITLFEETLNTPVN